MLPDDDATEGVPYANTPFFQAVPPALSTGAMASGPGKVLAGGKGLFLHNA